MRLRGFSSQRPMLCYEHQKGDTKPRSWSYSASVGSRPSDPGSYNTLLPAIQILDKLDICFLLHREHGSGYPSVSFHDEAKRDKLIAQS